MLTTSCPCLGPKGDAVIDYEHYRRKAWHKREPLWLGLAWIIAYAVLITFIAWLFIERF